MDPRIEKMLLELRQNEENKKLWNKRFEASLVKLQSFFNDNQTGINEIFTLTGAEFMTFYVDREKTPCISYYCYSPSIGFHIRIHQIGPSREIQSKFTDLRSFAEDFIKKACSPEQLTDCIADAFLSDQNFHK